MKNSSPQSSAQQPVPGQWPGAFKLFSIAKQATLTNWRTYLLLLVASVGISTVLSLSTGKNGIQNGLIAMVIQLVSYLISVYFGIATTIVELHNAQHTKTSFGESCSKANGYFLRYLCLVIIITAILSISLLLLVIPFLFVFPRLALAPYYLIAHDLGPIDAIKASWTGTKPHRDKVWGIVLATIVFCLPVLTIIGIVATAYLIFIYSSAFALLFYWIQKQPAPEAIAQQQVAPVDPVTSQ